MTRMLWRGTIGLLVLALTLTAVVLGKSAMTSSLQLAVIPVTPVSIDKAAAASRLATAVTFKTISFAPGLPTPPEEFRKLHAYMATNFPKLHQALKRDIVSEQSLLFTWPGRDASAKPILFMAHQDVVPVAPGTEGDWSTGAFDGTIKDGFVWGRGAWDNKGNMMAMLEAIELLAGAGFTPRQTVYIFFGHDEELGGRGAIVLAEKFKRDGVRLELVLDEGMIITEGIVPGLARPSALIGIAEKGYLTLQLTAKGTPGHSSMPPQQTAIGTLAAALTRLEATPSPASLDGIAGRTFAYNAPEMTGLNRVLLSNLWLFRPLVLRELVKTPSTNTMLRTTTAFTVLRAGEKDNVLPGTAHAAVNFRILPGDSVAAIIQRVQAIIGPNIEIKAIGNASEPSPVSSATSAGYRTIERTVRELFPEVVVAPGLMIAATDSRHLTDIADGVYRFSPTRARREDLSRFHGTNERIAIDNFAELIAFYHRLVVNLSAPAAVAQR